MLQINFAKCLRFKRQVKLRSVLWRANESPLTSRLRLGFPSF